MPPAVFRARMIMMIIKVPMRLAGRMLMFRAGGEGQARMKNHIPPG
jgi:hypothetical protein